MCKIKEEQKTELDNLLISVKSVSKDKLVIKTFKKRINDFAKNGQSYQDLKEIMEDYIKEYSK